MEWIRNYFTDLLSTFQPVNDFASEQPLSTLEENDFDTLDAQNEQTMGNSSNDEPVASSRNDQTEERTFSKEIINDFKNDDARRTSDNKEESCVENADTRNFQEPIDIVSYRENDTAITSSESELYSAEDSDEENVQETLDNSREVDSTEIEGPLQNQESIVNLQENSSHCQPTEFKKPDDDMSGIPSEEQYSKENTTANTGKSEQEQSCKGNTDTKNVNDDPTSTLGGGLPSGGKAHQKSIVNSRKDSKQKSISLLSELRLDPKEKITLKEARSVDSYTFTDEALTSADEIPKYILQKLMIGDYCARAFKLDNNELRELDDSEQSNDEDDDKEEDVKGSVNPMDAFLALFYCCDDFLRQDLAAKLSACQLSVPFLLPHPDEPTENITMLLWALDGIKKSWKKTNKDVNETFTDHQVFVMEHPFPIVSFIRIGKNMKSKSALLNKIISDVNGYHDFFFHQNCRGGGVERKIVDGLVELCWYLPGGRKHQAFEQEICFANLRGDAQKFSKQFNVLSQISSMMFLLLPSEYPDRSTQQILEKAMKAKGKIVLIFSEKRQRKSKGYFDNLKNVNRDKCCIISRAVKKNEDDFVVAIRAKIGINVEDTEPVPLKDLTFLANEYKILLDLIGCETNTRMQWRQNILKWFKKGPKEAKRQFRLQLQVPTIASLERENVCPTGRGNKSEEEYSNEIYNNIRAARNSQNDSFEQMDKEICKYINYIPIMDESERNYSLTILKHNLDQMSLAVLGSLQTDYRQTWFDTQREKKERRQQNDLNKEQESLDIRRLRELEEAIKESSFGLEHFLREMAQMFQLTEISIIDYAGAAAEILLSGQPLELMDGDSSYIPLKWFNAVFGKIEVITKNANIFVISVLGIQSSGKSTMLNTMFGLEFAVSAGRCTRGAFASLIPVSDSLKRESKYDFLLVIDTEGLRGSSDPQLRQHDNELATFAIGVADLTIVNIFGENYNDMKEFLEIAVHAFLKMKLVKEKRICQIVHQNVAAIDASNVLTTERITLKNKLDEMTKLAAIQENCESEIEELNNVLSFDENEDVSYIPSLLQGCPPMAPMNPEYGKAVQKVKDKIIKLMCLTERLPLSVSRFQKRVNGLWNTILRENFIFSFRNTIEVRAFTSLDQKFFEESVKIMVTKMAELEKTTSVSLMRSPADARKDIWEVQKLLIHETAEEMSGKMEKEMEVFFETNEDKATLEQWRENIMIKIRQLKESQEAEVKNRCQADFDYWQSRQEIDNMKLVYEKELLANAKEFITSIEAIEDVNARQQIFEQEWQKWIKKIPDCSVNKIDVGREMINFLCNTNKKLDATMKEKCKKQGFDIRNFKKCLAPIEHELKYGLFQRLLKLLTDNPQLVMDAESIRQRAINSVLNVAKDASRSGHRCIKSDLQLMYQKVVNTLKQGAEKKSFKFPDSLICDTLLYSFANAHAIFVEMEERYYRERDIKLELEENLKPKLKKYFMNLCNKMKKEVLAASSFVDVLAKAIKQELNHSMGPAVAKEILMIAQFQSKGQFHAKVLIDLGEQNLFSAYIDYLRNPVYFLKVKLQESIQIYCLHQTDSTITSLLEKEIDKIKSKVFSAVSNASKQITANGMGIHCWIERFVENCSTLAITRDMFSIATIDEDLKDFEVFENQVENNLNHIFQDLLGQGVSASVLRRWNPTPFDKLVDLMFGCDECCPFCKALCDQTLRNHDNEHLTRNHRPQGVTGYRYIDSNILVKNICTTEVAGESSFSNVHTSGKWHPYKDYKTVNDYYKSWSIAPDSSFEASLYWKWFMANFSKDLAKHYVGTKQPDIPSAWKDISFQDAKKQLRDQYNLR